MSALRVLAVLLAVLSLAGRAPALPSSSTTTRTIARASTELHALVAFDRVVNDWGAHARDARLVPLAALNLSAAWAISAAPLVGLVDWTPHSNSPAPAATYIAPLARGPPHR